MKAIFTQADGSVNFTPTADTPAGSVVVLGGKVVGIVCNPIPANQLGAVTVTGLVTVDKANGAITVGSPVYWNATGNPQGGTAGSGAATATATGAVFMGWATADAAAGDEKVTVRLGWPSPVPAA